MTKSTELSFRSFLPKPRAVAAMAFMFAIFAVGWRIPLPGLDLDKVADMSLSADAVTRLSIFALGVIPLFTVLIYAELAKLAIPALARWEARSTANAGRAAVLIAALSLIVASSQGYGVLLALGEGGGYIRSEPSGLPLAMVATLVASTALIIWLAANFRFPNLGNGFWVLVTIPFLAIFPDQLFALVELARTGAVPTNKLLILGVWLVVGTALAVFANLLLLRNGSADAVERTSILLWPSYLATILAGYAFVLLPVEMPGWPFASTSFFEVVHLALTLIFIPVFVFSYARCFRLSRPEGSHRWSFPVLLIVTLVQIFLTAGAAILPIYLGFPFSLFGIELLVLSTVMLGLCGTPSEAASRS